MMRILATVLQRELMISYRRRADLINPLLFFLIVVALFPIGVTPNLDELAKMAPGILWVAALLASLLSLDLLFRHDFDDGSLEQMLLSSIPAQLLVLCKAMNHWLVTGLPLTLLSPLLSVMLALPPAAVPLQMLTLALGTLTLSMLGSIGAAITVGLRKGGLLLTVLVMPLLVPVVIFGTSTVYAFNNELPWLAQLALLGACSAGAVALSPWLAVAALRISVGE